MCVWRGRLQLSGVCGLGSEGGAGGMAGQAKRARRGETRPAYRGGTLTRMSDSDE